MPGSRPIGTDVQQAKKKAAFPREDRPFLVSVNAPKGCDLLLFFSRSGRSSSGVGRSSGSFSGRSSSGVSGRGSSFRTSGSGVGAFSSGFGTFSSGVCGRSFGGGFFSSLFTASGEGEHAGGNGDSSKFLHDMWAP